MIPCQELFTVSLRSKTFKTWDERCSRAGLGFTVTNDTRDNQIGVIHDGTKRDRQCIAQLTTLVDCTGCLGVDMTMITRQLACSQRIDLSRISDLGNPDAVLNVEISW